ncbi:MAG: quinol dehydrogenase ferredoxin subunit NapH [Methylobacteriaceae bacterium]|nr:quinol dehydrogenase ferredoxin subunit NapH [Methylobacteriaceae bacterium]
MTANVHPYVEARERKGVWRAHRFGVLRRAAQLAFLALFLTGPLLGVWIAKGTLASSLTLNVLPLTDPFILAQSLAARHWPEATALTGAAIVLGAYLLLGGRSFCSWVCPLNPVADFAAFLRRRFDIRQTAKIRPELRNWIAGAAIVVSAISGVVAWELVNPVTAFHRALVFGLWFGLVPALAIFTFDLLVAKHGWCGHLCPVGACYGAIGKASIARVAAPARAACDDCMDCFAVCPEPHVITPALRGERTGASPVILSGDCTLCGACVDVCPEKVFAFTHRFDHRLATAADTSEPTVSRPKARAA